MSDAVNFDKVDAGNLETYILVGKNAYCEHYRYLWRYGNPSPYISRGFTLSTLTKDLQCLQSDHYIIRKAGIAVGIFKVVLDRVILPYGAEEVMFLEKIYLLKEHTGVGTGARTLRFIEDCGRQFKKKFLHWIQCKKGLRAIST